MPDNKLPPFDASSSLFGRHLSAAVRLFQRAPQPLKHDGDLSPAPAAAIQAFGCAVITTDLDGKVAYLNAAAQRLTGWNEAEAKALPLQAVAQLVDKVTRLPLASFQKHNLVDAREDGDEAESALLIHRKGGEYAVKYIATPMCDGAGHCLGTVLVFYEMTARAEVEALFERVAYRDPLTELPNRLLIGDRLQQALTKAQRNRGQLAVMLVDLDRFRNINDVLGQESGDMLLKAFAGRILSCLRASDSPGRYGGDTFMVVLPDLAKAQDVIPIARKILAAASQPYELGVCELFVTCSIGISIYPDDGQDAQALMAQAGSALQRAKEQGSNSYHFQLDSMNALAGERADFETSLRQALQQNQLEIRYQPKRNVSTGQITGVAAQVHWNHPDFGLLAPSKFMPLAEEMGLSASIGEWALNVGCSQAVKWRDAGLNLEFALSTRQLRDPQLAEKIAIVMQETGWEPARLELVFPETMLTQDEQAFGAMLRQLDALGIKLVVGQFGAGLSSLSALVNFPIKRIKIEPALIQAMTLDTSGATIVKAIISLAHELGLEVVAEGVEITEQQTLLQQRGCDEMQGDACGAPLLAAAFAQLVADGAVERAV
jgi:diguanylate cyclase (GGDEF)-like protein/PAS domain S-box-containing protein